MNCKTIHTSSRILLDWRKIIPDREIARINWVIQGRLLYSKNVGRILFKERYTINKIQTKASNICKGKLRDSKFFFSVLYFTSLYNVHLRIYNSSINNMFTH